jgi:GntR family transcriptional regulator
VTHLRIEERLATASAAARLGLEPGSSIVVIERLRTVDGQPFCFGHDEFVPLAGFTAGYRAAQPESLFDFLREYCGIVIDYAEAELTAVGARAAVARALGIRPGSPVVQLDQLHFDARGQPVFFSRAYALTDQFSFRIVRRAPRSTNQYGGKTMKLGSQPAAADRLVGNASRNPAP